MVNEINVNYGISDECSGIGTGAGGGRGGNNSIKVIKGTLHTNYCTMSFKSSHQILSCQ